MVASVLFIKNDPAIEIIPAMIELHIAYPVESSPDAMGRYRFAGWILSSFRSKISLKIYILPLAREKSIKVIIEIITCSTMSILPENINAANTNRFFVH